MAALNFCASKAFSAEPSSQSFDFLGCGDRILCRNIVGPRERYLILSDN